MRKILLFLFIAPLLWAQQTSIAVSELQPQGMSTTEAAIISDRLREELLNTGKMRVMERGMMDEILKEQSLVGSGACNSSQCEVQMGRLLGVDRVAVGRVGKFGALYTLSVRLLNVETGEILVSVSEDHEGAMEGLLKGPLKRIAARLANPTPATAAPSVTPPPPKEVPKPVPAPLVEKPMPAPVVEKPLPAPVAEKEKPSLSPGLQAPVAEKTSWGKRILQIGLGIAVLGFGGTGLSFNMAVSDANQRAQDGLADFKKGDDSGYQRYENGLADARNKTTPRNICYGLAGASLAAFALTFTF